MTDQLETDSCRTTFGASEKIGLRHLNRWAIVYVKDNALEARVEN